MCVANVPEKTSSVRVSGLRRPAVRPPQLDVRLQRRRGPRRNGRRRRSVLEVTRRHCARRFGSAADCRRFAARAVLVRPTAAHATVSGWPLAPPAHNRRLQLSRDQRCAFDMSFGKVPRLHCDRLARERWDCCVGSVLCISSAIFREQVVRM